MMKKYVLILILLPKLIFAANSPFGIFSKQQQVFGIKVYGTRYISKQNFEHVVSILSQYLDNDSDGNADNPLVIEKLKANRASLVVFSHQGSALAKQFFREFGRSDMGDKIIVQDMYQDEIAIPNGREGQFDASLEEILHLVTQAGYSCAYPNELGDKPGSQLALAMDSARGGHYKKVPNRYPVKAWYTYYDRTCDYQCQVTEYFYWLLTSLLSSPGDGQDFQGRRQEIIDEWRPNTSLRVKQQDKKGYALMTNSRFHLPTRLPH